MSHPPKRRSWTLLTVAALALTASALTLRADDAPPAPKSVESGAAQVDPRLAAWAEQLASPDYATRDKATASLKEQGTAILPALQVLYRRTCDHEVRMRLREVAERVIYRQALSELGGFLGIRPKPVPDDPRVGKGQVVVQVTEVVADSSADRAGIEVDDVIYEVDDQPLTFDPRDGEGFARLIRAKKVGDTMRFALFRGDERMTLEIELGHRPIEHANPAQSAWRDQVVRLLDEAQRQFEAWASGLDGPGSE